MPSFIRVPLMKLEWEHISKLINAPIDIIWSFDPFRFQDLHLLPALFKLFHSVDLVKSPWAEYTARHSDLVLASNSKILERYRDLKVRKYLLGHGLSRNFFLHRDQPDSFQIEKKGRPAIGYSGNLLIEYLDREILLDLVRSNPDCDFYFFGPYTKSNLTPKFKNQSSEFVSQLMQQENTILLGAVPNAQLFHYLYQMDVLLICYNTRLYSDAVADSHKVLEYLSTGKTVISSYMSSYEQYPNLIEMTNDNTKLCQVLRKVLGELEEYNSKSKADVRMQFALDRSYRKRIEEIENVMNQCYQPEPY